MRFCLRVILSLALVGADIHPVLGGTAASLPWAPAVEGYTTSAVPAPPLFERIQLARRQTSKTFESIASAVFYFKSGDVVRRHGVKVAWLSSSTRQLDALDRVLSRLSPEAKSRLPPIVVWPGILPKLIWEISFCILRPR